MARLNLRETAQAAMLDPKQALLDSLGDIIAAFLAAYVYRTRYAARPWEWEEDIPER